MKNFFAILAMICMVAIAVPASAIDMDDDGEQVQGGINIYLENAAFESIMLEDAFGASGTIVYEDFNADGSIGALREYGKIAGSADIVAAQASFQAQENDTDINFCNKEEIYFRDYDYLYDYSYYDDYYQNEERVDIDAPVAGEYDLRGQTQTWTNAMQFDTGYGVVNMLQQGTQSGMSAVFTQQPGLNIGEITVPEMNFQGTDVKVLD